MKGQEVVLIPQAAEGNAVTWTMVHDGKVAQGSGYPAVEMSKDKKKEDITFTIVDINNLGVTFNPTVIDNGSNPKALEAIWIVPKGATKKGGPYPAQIDSVGLKSGTQLVVGDKNSDGSVMDYQLNFLRGGNRTTSIDPEIRNGGGTKAPMIGLETVVVLLSVAVLALVGLQWVTHLRNRRAKV
jgi:hypothetical protein